MAGPGTERSGRSILTPVVYGIVAIVALIAVTYFRSEVWQGVKWVVSQTRTLLTEWVPNHPGQSFAIGAFALLAVVLNWFSHVRGRLRAWVFAIVVEAGVWLLFWYGLLIPSFNELLGLNISQMSLNTVLLSGGLVIGLTGMVFWLLEAREGWRRYRRSVNVDDD